MIPTADRPESLRRTLQSLAAQRLRPHRTLVVDAGREDAASVCAELGWAEHLRARPGLTSQRRVGNRAALEDPLVEYILHLDDDVVLDDDMLARMVAFLDSDAGRAFGGLSAYEMVECGRPFLRRDRMYARLGLGDFLCAGAWLYCGAFVECGHVQPSEGVVETDFLMGCSMLYRASALRQFAPPAVFHAYAVGEDKHLSLRVGVRWKLGVLGTARLWHLRGTRGRRWGPTKIAYFELRHSAQMLRDCDPVPSVRRYVAFLAFHALDIAVDLAGAIASRRWRVLSRAGVRAASLVGCAVFPPRRSSDALSPAPSRGRRRLPKR